MPKSTIDTKPIRQSESGRGLSAEISHILADRQQTLPVWVRASTKTGYEHYTGLSRAKLYELANAGKIRTASLREPGKLRGCRLFHLPSILAFINSCVLVPDASMELPADASKI